MTRLEHIPVGAMNPHRFESVISAAEYEQLLGLIGRSARQLRGRVIWNVNSTARGGGVVELLRPLLGYSRGAGVDARWVVITGGPEFFTVTKRLHNHLHGIDGDGGGLFAAEREIYEQTLAGNAAALVKLVRPNDVVILHDPQTAGLTATVRRTGATVIWRCHVGLDHANDYVRAGWDFLRPYLLDADAYVFSRAEYAWDGLPEEKITVIQPSIDVFSPKNAGQTLEQSLAILSRAGIVAHRSSAQAMFTRTDGTPGRVDRSAEIRELAPMTARDRVIVQVSRWDRLKDPLGVVRGFADHIAHRSDAHLLLAGPATESVADDPEGMLVYRDVLDTWEALPEPLQRRVHLASLPMDDLEENAAIVNAVQRHADVVVQKSLAEGFGLTVAEAMWKERPVVASRVGGIQDQIVDRVSGILVPDGRDLRAFGSAVASLLADPEEARRIGAAARTRVRANFLGPHHLARYFELIEGLIAAHEEHVPA
jgi:trehalose synthase